MPLRFGVGLKRAPLLGLVVELRRLGFRAI